MRYVITGAASGIGRAVARLAAQNRDGYGEVSLALVDRNQDGLDEAASEVQALGAKTVTLQGDLGDPETPARVVAAAATHLGGLDVVVSNAGITAAAALEDVDLDTWERTFAINTRATMLLGQAAFPHLKDSQGALVATVSISGTHPTPPLAAYSPSKAALRMLVQQMALEWGRHGIRCNAVSPGPTDTGLTRDSFGEGAGQAAERNRAWREKLIPLGRIGRPEDVAEAVLFLASPRARQITGVDLLVDGGVSLAVMPLAGGAPGWLPARERATA
jgi:NAD(P)-dependent dehydrogenase (short-subunit alcohol dehydrogenase family)